VRPRALATLVNTTGNGIFFTLSALYFTRIVGFSVVEVDTGLSIAASIAIFAGVPLVTSPTGAARAARARSCRPGVGHLGDLTGREAGSLPAGRQSDLGYVGQIRPGRCEFSCLPAPRPRP
jgi:hypothetical protein